MVLEEVDQNLRTEPGFFTNLYPGDIMDGAAYGDVQAYLRRIDVATHFTGYKLVDESTGHTRQSDASEVLPQNNLHSVCITLPSSYQAGDGVGALEHMVRVGAMFVIPADRFDASTYSQARNNPEAYYYENYSGGIGIAKKLFEVWPAALKKRHKKKYSQVWPTALEEGVKIAENCGCQKKCPNCIEPAKSYNVSNANIDKRAGIELARRVLEAAESEPNFRWSNGMMVPV